MNWPIVAAGVGSSILDWIHSEIELRVTSTTAHTVCLLSINDLATSYFKQKLFLFIIHTTHTSYNDWCSSRLWGIIAQTLVETCLILSVVGSEKHISQCPVGTIAKAIDTPPHRLVVEEVFGFCDKCNIRSATVYIHWLTIQIIYWSAQWDQTASHHSLLIGIIKGMLSKQHSRFVRDSTCQSCWLLIQLQIYIMVWFSCLITHGSIEGQWPHSHAMCNLHCSKLTHSTPRWDNDDCIPLLLHRHWA